jgi:DNA mismatch repair protein MutS
MAVQTPMMQQYMSIKAQYEDAFLFFRLGDFYEMFFEDAKKAAQELEITLTSREGGKNDRTPMCGVPHHAVDNYISQLIEKGYKVAICEQTEDPKQAKGVVKREVVKLITPGTVMDGKMLREKENNYLVSVSLFDDGSYGLAANDLTTGESRVTLITAGWEDVISEIATTGAKEVIIGDDFGDEKRILLQKKLDITVSLEDEYEVPEPFLHIVKELNDQKCIDAFGRLLQYLLRTQKRSLDHLQPVSYYETNEYMKLDIDSKRNLELVESIRGKGKKGSLLWLLDKTVTAMGGRLLKHWIERPLLNRETISKRLSIVETLMQQFFERADLREKLQGVYDLERLAGRVAYGNANARDLIQLKQSLQQIPEITAVVKNLNNRYSDELVADIDLCQEVVSLLEKGIQEDPPFSVKEGNLIKDSYNETLDQYREASRNGKDWIASLQQRERQETGIKSLKIGYNKVFGYYIEVTKANIGLLPEGRYDRKQTLANAERYITPELKEKETLILEAEEKMVDLEYDLFLEIREIVKDDIPQLQKLAKTVSELDVLQSFAVVSEEDQFVKPDFSERREIDIKDGRHPVVEKVMEDEAYVANDVYMDHDRDILMITGPNMAGKSTYMRQLALVAVMTQIGCFVPAAAAKLPIFDQVFTRIGAADDLVGGKSTFMVEMLETQYALTKATENSLILLDEIGRGTSTYDGIALAQAIIEHIHDHVHAKTLFSTHYHELTSLDAKLSRLKNVHVGAMEEEGNVVFLHKVMEGAADKSYGIHVAKLADLPDGLINRAEAILVELEADGSKPAQTEKQNNRLNEESGQLSFFTTTPIREKNQGKKGNDLLKTIQSLDLLSMTPLDAINKLYELQKEIK